MIEIDETFLNSIEFKPICPLDTPENILLNYIEYLKTVERTRGLSDEQIIAKYTHGGCSMLSYSMGLLVSNYIYNPGEELRSKEYNITVNVPVDNRMAAGENYHSYLRLFKQGPLGKTTKKSKTSIPRRSLYFIDYGFFDILGKHEEKELSYYKEQFWKDNQHLKSIAKELGEEVSYDSPVLILNHFVNKILRPSDFRKIYGNLTNPFDNLDLIIAINEEIIKNGELNIRRLKLNNEKKRIDNKYRTNKEKYEIIKTIVKDNTDYYLSRYKVYGDKSLIPNDEEYNHIREYMTTNLTQITRAFAHVNSLRDISSFEIKHITEQLGLNPNEKYLFNFIKTIRDCFNFITQDHFCEMDNSLKEKRDALNQDDTRIYINSNHYDIRIYINTSPAFAELFINSYIKKCREYSIGFNMKGIDKPAGHEGKDMTILYLFLKDLPINIRILEEIKREHPEWIEAFGVPPYSCATLNNSYYGIGHAGIYLEDKEKSDYYGIGIRRVSLGTYSDYFDTLCQSAFYSNLCRYIIKESLINADDEYYNAILALSKLQKTNIRETLGITSSTTIDGILLWEIEEYINNNNFKEKLEDRGYTFRDSAWILGLKARMQVIHNLAQGFKPNVNISPAISNYMIKDVFYKKDQKSTEKEYSMVM